MEPRLLLQSELASRWRVSRRTLERWRCSGEGPQFCKIGGRITYREIDVIAYESDQLRQVTPSMPRR
jgi:hypothetical protein